MTAISIGFGRPYWKSANETNIKDFGSTLNHMGNPFKMFAGAVVQARKYTMATTSALLKSDPPTADIQ
jgi:hypothetical protein